jgi:hypothetical protein
MAEGRTPDDATLLDVLIDGFEKNELIDGFHWRQLPMPNEHAALRKFSSLTSEAQQWKGPPSRVEEAPGRRLAAWPDLEIRLAGRGLMVRSRMPRFSDWWHDKETWQGDPMGPIFDWIAEGQH